jgi:hypothetical protein
MLTTGSKWFAGLGVVSLVLAAAYGWTTGGNGLGPVTLGYHGAVGDHLGYGVLVAAGVVALFLALVSVATRDADADVLARLAGTDEPPAATPPGSRTYWPLISAFGAALVALGLVAGSEMFIAGVIVLVAVLVEWMVLAWSDRATGDPATNTALRDRLMRPLEYPIAALLAIGVVLFGFSRLFLTTSANGAVAAAGVLAALIFVGGILVAARPSIPPTLVASVLVVAAIGTLALGVVGAARGEREFHEHHEEDHDGPRNRVLIPSAAGIGGEGD